jgi:hypothetical protein
MSECRDNQEVGLEAATLERVRNSSLVKCSRSFGITYAVGERSDACEAAGEPSRGCFRSENAGVSNERGVRIPSTDCPRFPEQRSSAQGQSGPKARPKGVVDGQRVDIPVPRLSAITDGGTRKAKGTPPTVERG